jgi:hypothetical protein
MSNTAAASLLYRLVLDIGDAPLTLDGQVTLRGEELWFSTPDRTRAPADGSTPPAPAMPSWVDPLGLEGVVLTTLDVAGRIYREDGEFRTELALVAGASFTRLPQLQLSGAVVLDGFSPRLAAVRLSVTEPLSLTDFLKASIDTGSSWLDEVTDQFEFLGGLIYWLKGTGDPKYIYRIPASLPVGPADCSPGYHLQGGFRLFRRFNFDVKLSVADGLTRLSARARRFDFGFAVLGEIAEANADDPPKEVDEQVRVQVSFVSGGDDKVLAFSTPVSVFGSPVALAEGEYRIESKAFRGSLTDDVHGTGLSLQFLWDEAGFRVDAIGGFPFWDLDLAREFLGVLNDVRDGGCEEILESWFNDLMTTSLKPVVDGSPVSKGDGRYELPLRLDYRLSFAGSDFEAQMPFTLELAAPASFGAFPGALLNSLAASAPRVAGDMLSNPDTYKAIMGAVAARHGAAALARFLCRLLQEALAKLVQALTTMLGFLGPLLGALLAVLDALKDAFSDENDKKRRRIERQIRAVQSSTEQDLAKTDALVEQIRGQLRLQTLAVTLQSGAQVEAGVTWKDDWSLDLHEGGRVRVYCRLRFLEGDPGARPSPPLRELFATETQALPVRWSIPEGEDYRMNAVAQGVLRGMEVLPDAMRGSLEHAIGELHDADNDAASDFADYLQSKLNAYNDLDEHGVRGPEIYAGESSELWMGVGQSRVGVNTRLPKPGAPRA